MPPSSPSATIAHKFGGSSLADASRIGAVVDILQSRDEPQVVVVSAMRGVTDALIALTHLAATGEQESWQAQAGELQQTHQAAAEALLETDVGLVC